MDIDFSVFQSMLENSNKETGVVAMFYDKVVRTGIIMPNGLPEFKEKPYVRIKTRDNSDIFDQPASQEHVRRFPVEYNRYILEKKEIKSGTPLTEFAFLTKIQLENCKFRGVFTVERLAELTDEQAKDIGLTEEKELAIRFIEVSKNNKKIDDFTKKEKKYQTEIKKLKEQIEELKGKLNG